VEPEVPAAAKYRCRRAPLRRRRRPGLATLVTRSPRVRGRTVRHEAVGVGIAQGDSSVWHRASNPFSELVVHAATEDGGLDAAAIGQGRGRTAPPP